MSDFDPQALLAELEAWCRAQQAVRARLVRHEPLTPEAIELLPTRPESYPWELPDAWRAQDFVVPASYRAFLRCCGGAYIEVCAADDDAGDDDAWQRWEVFNVFRPGDCARPNQGAAAGTLCDAWTAAGATVDDRPFSTTAFLSFASAGLDVEASRWCFYVQAGREPSVWLESNDYECTLGRYTDTDEPEWLGDDAPVFPDFAAWLTAVVQCITAQPLLDFERNDARVGAIVERGQLLGVAAPS